MAMKQPVGFAAMEGVFGAVYTSYKSQGISGLTRPHDYFDLKGTRWAASQRCIAGRRGGGGTGNA
jgi:hypothetical protein